MTDDLWDQSLIIQQMKAVSWVEGYLKGCAKGLIKAHRTMVISIVEVKFPRLADLAHQKVVQTTSIEELDGLYMQIMATTNEAEAHALLTTTVD